MLGVIIDLTVLTLLVIGFIITLDTKYDVFKRRKKRDEKLC